MVYFSGNCACLCVQDAGIIRTSLDVVPAVDYVLLLSPRPKFAQHPYMLEIMEQLNQAYTKVTTTELGRASLYKKRYCKSRLFHQNYIPYENTVCAYF
jgi:hypothetical protein